MTEEFTDEQIKRLDDIENTTQELIKVLVKNEDFPWDANIIWDIIYSVARDLVSKGHKVYIPTHVIEQNGEEYITDEFEDD